METGFKFIDRGFKETIVLIPGWATDYRIFQPLELDFNYLLPLKFLPLNFVEKLKLELDKKKIKKISLFGWSMGAFLAIEFALVNPERVEELILLSIKERFDPVVLKNIELKLEENKQAYLYKFYLNFFSDNDKEELRWFKTRLLKKYLNEMEFGDLKSGLEYLSKARIDFQSLALFKKVRIFHGEEDRIVAFEEALQIKSRLPLAKLIGLKGIGHILFLKKNFTQVFYNG